MFSDMSVYSNKKVVIQKDFPSILPKGAERIRIILHHINSLENVRLQMKPYQTPFIVDGETNGQLEVWCHLSLRNLILEEFYYLRMEALQLLRHCCLCLLLVSEDTTSLTRKTGLLMDNEIADATSQFKEESVHVCVRVSIHRHISLHRYVCIASKMNQRGKIIYEHVAILLHPFHLLLLLCYTKLLFIKGSNFVLTCRTPGSPE